MYVVKKGRRTGGLWRLLVKRLSPTKNELEGYLDHDAKDVFAVNAKALKDRRTFTLSFPHGGFVSLGVPSILTLLLKPPTRRITSS